MARRFRIRMRKGVTVMQIVKRLMFTLIGLYAGGLIYTTFGTFMNGTCSPFYTGFQLIGWTVAAPSTVGTGTTAQGCVTTNTQTIIATTPTTVTLLGIAGLIALISVVTSIFSMRVR